MGATRTGVDRGLAESDEVYDRYLKHLEAEHWGEYAAVTPGGGVLLGGSVREVADRVLEAAGRGSRSRVYKIGPREVGRL